MKEYHLCSPIEQKDIRALKIGDLVYVSGRAFTCRSKLQRAVFDEGLPLPQELLENEILIHVGPIVLKEGAEYRLVSFMPTSSIRFEKWGAKTIKEWGLKVIVGKTTMSDETAQTMQKLGCVHLSPRSVSPNLWVKSIQIENVYLHDEMGSIEAPWQLNLHELGPFVVDIDTHGGRLFNELDKKVQKRLDDAYKSLDIPADFRYTKLY
jgi:L(+)-tartrate dehydratase beta subunit